MGASSSPFYLPMTDQAEVEAVEEAAEEAITQVNLIEFALSLPDETPRSAQYYKEIETARTGEFTDMRGRKFAITTELMDALVENFANGTMGQDIPIDIQHERKEAAGWLVGVRRLNNSLFVAPDWNPHGRFLIESKAYRYVSATIDMVRKCLVTVSLTNFPAVSKLQAVELSSPHVLAAPAVIFQQDQQEEKQPMNEDSKEKTPVAGTPAQPPSQPAPAPVVEASAPTQPAQPIMADAMRQEVEAFRAQLRTELAREMAEFATERQRIVTEAVQGVREERQLAEFCDAATGTGKHALPLTKDELLVELSGMPKQYRDRVVALLQKITEAGTLDFSEVGTSQGKQVSELVAMDRPMQAVLSAYLDNGGTVEKFFEMNQDILEPQSRYDLSKFTKSKE